MKLNHKKLIAIAGAILFAAALLAALLLYVAARDPQLEQQKAIKKVFGEKGACFSHCVPDALFQIPFIGNSDYFSNHFSACFLGIDANGSSTSNEDLKALGGYRRLKQLSLSGTKVDDEGIHYLTGLPNLDYLNLSKCGISDRSAGILAKIKTLQFLSVVNTKITDAGIHEIRDGLPNCTLATDDTTYYALDLIKSWDKAKKDFHECIKDADCIVIRDGGFDCCHSPKDDKELMRITNPGIVKEFYENIKFDDGPMGDCMCCGYPGIDWHCGGKRLALTSVKHGFAIRWKGFQGDAGLTKESAIWLRRFLLTHDINGKFNELKGQEEAFQASSQKTSLIPERGQKRN